MPFIDSYLPLVTVQTGGTPIPNEPKIGATMGVIRDPLGGRSNLQTTPANFAGQVGNVKDAQALAELTYVVREANLHADRAFGPAQYRPASQRRR